MQTRKQQTFQMHDESGDLDGWSDYLFLVTYDNVSILYITTYVNVLRYVSKILP